MIRCKSYFRIKNGQISIINKRGDEEKVTIINNKKVLFKTDYYNKIQKKIIETFIQYVIELNKLNNNNDDLLIPTANFEDFTLGMCYNIKAIEKLNVESKYCIKVYPKKWYKKVLSPISFDRLKNESFYHFKKRIIDRLLTSIV